MAHDREISSLVDDLVEGRLSRRSLLRRAAALGISAPALGLLLQVHDTAAQGGEVNIASNESDPEPRANAEQTVVDFEAKSGIKPNLNITDHEAFKQQIRTFLAGNNPPDVLTWFAGNRMRFFSDRELLLPLDDLFQAEGWMTEYTEGILATSKGTDGKLYFVPTNYYWWAINYRPSLFQKAGIEVVPETWDQLLAACDQLTAAGITPFALGAKAPWPAAAWFDYLNMRVNGPEFHVQLTDGKAAYNSPEVKETFRHWRMLLDKNAFIDTYGSLEWADALTPMLNGEAAMYLMGGFITDSVPDENEADLDFFKFPKINDVPQGEDAPTDGYFMAAKAENVDQGKAFLAYVGGEEYQTKVATELGRIAVHTAVPPETYDARIQKGLQLLQNADYIAQFYDRDTTPEMAEKGMAAFINFMRNPDDVDAILNDLDEERKRIFAADV